MSLTLKEYQSKALSALDTFFAAARDAATLHVAFNAARRATMGEALRDMPHRPLSAEFTGRRTAWR